jgi:hypothetical protein
MKTTSISIALAAAVLALAARPGSAQDKAPPAAAPAPAAWVYPQDVKCAGRRLTLHEPQMTSFDGPTFKAVVRFPVTLTDPLGRASYGDVEVSGFVKTDFSARLFRMDTLDVAKSAFPGIPEKDAASVQAGLPDALPKSLVFRLEILTARPGYAPPALSPKFDAKPPQILVRMRPAVLVQVDGDPVMLDVETFGIQYVANTASDVFRDVKTDMWYLLVDGNWMQAKSLTGTWRRADGGPPSALSQIPLTHPRGHVRRFINGTPEYAKQKPPAAPKEMPEVIVTDKPSELVLLAGDPLFTLVPGVRLMNVANSESDLFFHPKSNLYYLLVAGRWFSADDVDAAWTPVETLPEEFAKIPRDSIRGHVAWCVPGTPEAAEACAQAALEERGTLNKNVQVNVLYVDDKPPVTAPLEGDVKLVTNTEDDCFVVGDAFYVCQRGAWFRSEKGTGGWKPATTLPDALNKLSEATGYWHVHASRPLGVEGETATFALSAGYYGVFPWKGVPVYGSATAKRGLLRNSNWYPSQRTWGEGRWYDPATASFQPRSVRPRADGSTTADEWSPYTASYGRVPLYACRYDQGGRRMFPFDAETSDAHFNTAVSRPDVWSMWLADLKAREGLKPDAFPLGDRSGETAPEAARFATDDAGHVWRMNEKGAETFADNAWKAGKPSPEIVSWLATLARIDARPAQWKRWHEQRSGAIPVNPVVTPKTK